MDGFNLSYNVYKFFFSFLILKPITIEHLSYCIERKNKINGDAVEFQWKINDKCPIVGYKYTNNIQFLNYKYMFLSFPFAQYIRFHCPKLLLFIVCHLKIFIFLHFKFFSSFFIKNVFF